MNQQNCMHEKLVFDDGDYHIECSNCGACWAMISRTTSQGEFVSPESANQGIGASLTGEIREKRP